MKSKFLRLLLLGAGMILPACAGHLDVVKEMADYQPPALYQPGAVLPRVPAPLNPSPEDNAFEAQKGKLEELRKAWEKILASPPRKTSFFIPDPHRQKQISTAFTHDEAAQKILSNGFSLEDLEILTAGRNALIKNGEKTFLASLEGYSQASILDDIIRSYSAYAAGNMTGVGTLEDMESIDRKFPFPGVLALKGDIVGQEANLALMDLEIIQRTILTQARKNYHEQGYNGAAKEIFRQTLTLLEDLEASVTRRYETGRSQIPELTRITLQKDKIGVALLNIAQQGMNIEKRLKSLLLLPDWVKIGIPAKSDAVSTLPLPGDLIEAALRHRQELKKIRIMITRMELMIEMAETEIYPGVTPNLALTENRAVTGTGTLKMEDPFALSVSASMGAGLPRMPWTGLSGAYLRETRQRLLALKEELKAKEAETGADVLDAWVTVEQAKREAELYGRGIDALSRLNFSVSAKAYASGSIPFSDTMDALLLMFDTQLITQRKTADLLIALADLCQTVGVSNLGVLKEKDPSNAE